MKKLEKLEKFQLINKKLETVLGGETLPVKSFLNVDAGTETGAGEACIANGQCSSYTSDTLYSNGGYVYRGIKFNDKPC